MICYIIYMSSIAHLLQAAQPPPSGADGSDGWVHISLIQQAVHKRPSLSPRSCHESKSQPLNANWGRLLRKKPVLDLCMMVMMIVNLWEEPSTNRDTTNDSLYLAIWSIWTFFERPHWLLVIPKWKGPLSQLLRSVANLANFCLMYIFALYYTL